MSTLLSTDALFVHLRVHSAYSLAEGALKIPEIISLCHQHAMPAVAVTDTVNLFGALELSMACAEQGIQFIVGCQMNLWLPHAGASAHKVPDQLVLLAQNEIGYRHLIKLVSRSYLAINSGDRPHITMGDLEAYNQGLLVLTGGPKGTLGRLLLAHQQDASEEFLIHLARIFPGRLYMEIMRHGLEAEKRLEPLFLDLAYAHDIPLVATNDVFFGTPDMFEAHDALLCIAEGSYVNQAERRRETPVHYFKSASEMYQAFADLPEALHNTTVIAQRCAFMPRPQKPMLPPYLTDSHRSEAEELQAKAYEGLEKRLKTQVFVLTDDETMHQTLRNDYEKRLEYELEVIEKMGFSGYFLIVADFIQWAKGQNIPVGPGRGSGAGSLVAWSLTITDIDPIRFNLLFERFLNPERVSMPDFDIDFCQDRRDEVIEYVRNKYGADHVAQIITFGKLQARAVIRDVGRVLQMPYGQVDKICKLIPNNPTNPTSLEQAVALEPILQQSRDREPVVAKLINIGMKLEGLYRHASTHAAGVVIGSCPLDEVVPLYREERSNLPATQFSMKYVELAGLLKFDFLGLKTLTVIEHCCQLLQENGLDINISQIPLDDRKTFDLLCRVDVVGVFQVEGAGMRDVLRRMQPDRFEDLIALVALYRPGPMDDIPRYLACKHGEEQVTYAHPQLKSILKETYGVMVYQEQVMQIAQLLGGYSLGAADLLRRAMGKKIKAEMDAQRSRFVEGAIKNGVGESIASQIFDQMAKFAGYGFNKSHSAPYALLVYQTAYLKVNHAHEFYAASMTYDIHNTDKLMVYRQDLQKSGILLLPPDINQSDALFRVESLNSGTRGVRYGLAAIKNVGLQAMKDLVAERNKNGLFKDMEDFISRLDGRILNKRQMEGLIAAGAFDTLYPNRQELWLNVDKLLRQGTLIHQERRSFQASLFNQSVRQQSLTLVKNEEWPRLEKLKKELESLGFFLSAHPLDGYISAFPKLGIILSQELMNQADGTVVKLAGIILSKRERVARSGQRYAFVQLSDTHGVFEVSVFAEVFVKTRDLLEPGTPLFVTATIRQEGEGYRLMATVVNSLESVMQTPIKSLKIRINPQVAVRDLERLLTSGGSGSVRVCLEVCLKETKDAQVEAELYLPETYAMAADIHSQLLMLPGVLTLQEE